MFKNNTFQRWLFISFLVHSAIFLYGINSTSLLKNIKKDKNLEITYITSKEVSSLLESSSHTNDSKKEIIQLKRTTNHLLKNKEALLNPPQIDNLISQQILNKPILNTNIVAIKKKIDLPPVNLEKINNPSYLTYYQVIREKIRRYAYQNYNRADIGKIYLSFIVSSDGNLKDIKLIEEKSTQNQYLKDVALKSIRDASPFPPFPTELNSPYLSFNVIISFENE